MNAIETTIEELMKTYKETGSIGSVKPKDESEAKQVATNIANSVVAENEKAATFLDLMNTNLGIKSEADAEIPHFMNKPKLEQTPDGYLLTYKDADGTEQRLAYTTKANMFSIYADTQKLEPKYQVHDLQEFVEKVAKTTSRRDKNFFAGLSEFIKTAVPDATGFEKVLDSFFLDGQKAALAKTKETILAGTNKLSEDSNTDTYEINVQDISDKNIADIVDAIAVITSENLEFSIQDQLGYPYTFTLKQPDVVVVSHKDMADQELDVPDGIKDFLEDLMLDNGD